MRRTDRAIEEEDVLRKILRSTQYVTIAMSLDNQPYLVSLSHGYDEKRNCIYFHCAQEGRKLDCLRSNNKIWGQALLDYGYAGTEKECTHLYASVHFSGKVAFLDSLYEKRRAIACIINQLNKDPEQLIGRLENERLSNTMLGRIDIEYMSGKKSTSVLL